MMPHINMSVMNKCLKKSEVLLSEPADIKSSLLFKTVSQTYNVNIVPSHYEDGLT